MQGPNSQKYQGRESKIQECVRACVDSLHVLYGNNQKDKQEQNGRAGDTTLREACTLLQELVTKWKDTSNERINSEEAHALPQCVLISYGDTIISDFGVIDSDAVDADTANFDKSHAGVPGASNEHALVTLERFLVEYASDCIEGLHVLPFFPYSSDDGFSISDYENVRKDLGTWKDIHSLADSFTLMADLVLNHCSQDHQWFRAFLKNEVPYNDYFVTAQPNADVSKVVRPRPHPLLSQFTVFPTSGASSHSHSHALVPFNRYVWTTFSRDQVDLNYANPKVLFEFLHYMLSYVLYHRVSLIRLDAVAYVWKELGTSCIHRPKTYQIIRLMRIVLDCFAPWCSLITETNVPHVQNVSYLGSGDLAHMIYQFSLPPLLVHTFLQKDATKLISWIRSLEALPTGTTYFNFCASHDGIGITPSYNILNDDERQDIVTYICSVGGEVSYKATEHGDVPYELNCNFLSAIAPASIHGKAVSLSVAERAKKFLASQAIAMVMPGIFGLYIHSFLGSENWTEGVKKTGSKRSINREQLHYDTLCQELDCKGSLRNLVWQGMRAMLRARLLSPALDALSPYRCVEYRWVYEGTHHGVQNGIKASKEQSPLFVLERGPYQNKKILCIVNVTNKVVNAYFDDMQTDRNVGARSVLDDELLYMSDKEDKMLRIEAYQVVLLEIEC